MAIFDENSPLPFYPFPWWVNETKASRCHLIGDFDWKSIPATAVQFRGVRGEFFAVFADFRDFWLEIALEGFEIPQTPGGDKSLF